MLKFRFLVMTALLVCAIAPTAAHAERTFPFEIQLPECAPQVPLARIHMYPPAANATGMFVIKTEPDVVMRGQADGTWFFGRSGEALPASVTLAPATHGLTIRASGLSMQRDPDGTHSLLVYAAPAEVAPCKISSSYGTIIRTPATQSP